MSPREIFALRDYLDPALKGRSLSDARHVASLTDIADQTCLNGRLGELSGRSVLLAVTGHHGHRLLREPANGQRSVDDL